jgi:hypothetical protein
MGNPEMNNQAVMALARKLIETNWTASNDSWTYHDYGIVRLVAELTGLSESEVAFQLHPDLTGSINLIIGKGALPDFES